MFKKVILTLCLLSSISLTNYSLTELKNTKGTEYTRSENNNTDNWVLEFHDNKWWWVLYDPDGNRIQEIPVDF